MTNKAETVACDNAGLVLLHLYFQPLFKRLELLDGNHFAAPEAAARAISALHYVATGLGEVDADRLPLCKLLTGIPLDTPVVAPKLPDDARLLCDSLLQSAIGHWPAIGQQSLAGFRGNFLQRAGSLVAGEDRWTLTVEKRAYDLLIAQSPFGVALVRYPWMRQPVHVVWPI